MANRTCRIVCYDIRDDQRWRRVEKIVKGYGERIQYSIFRCWLTDRQYEALLWKLERELAPEDSLLVIPLPPEVERRVVHRNLMTDWERNDDSFVVY